MALPRRRLSSDPPLASARESLASRPRRRARTPSSLTRAASSAFERLLAAARRRRPPVGFVEFRAAGDRPMIRARPAAAPRARGVLALPFEPALEPLPLRPAPTPLCTPRRTARRRPPARRARPIVRPNGRDAKVDLAGEIAITGRQTAAGQWRRARDRPGCRAWRRPRAAPSAARAARRFDSDRSRTSGSAARATRR